MFRNKFVPKKTYFKISIQLLTMFVPMQNHKKEPQYAKHANKFRSQNQSIWLEKAGVDSGNNFWTY